MEFRLVYEGPLPAAGSGSGGGRVKEKHQLRKCFHLQLRELWHHDLSLKTQANLCFVRGVFAETFIGHVDPAVTGYRRAAPNEIGAKKFIDWIADDHIRCKENRFVPLVSVAGGFTCSLDILFLRRDSPGNIIDSGGDIDNRIKVLLDGLRMPVDVTELGGLSIDHDEDPFYCLLEDDKLITSVSVTTDRLLAPRSPTDRLHDVYLVIHVTVVNPAAIFAGGRLV